jgi:hypothetical protein
MRLGSLAARSQVANRVASANALRQNSRQPAKGALVQNTRAPFFLHPFLQRSSNGTAAAFRHRET